MNIYKKKCPEPECDGLLIKDKENGVILCRKCGLKINTEDFYIFQENINTINRKDKINSKGEDISTSNLMSEIGFNTLNDTKRICDMNLKCSVKRNSCLSWKQHNMFLAINELKRLCSKFNLPNYVNELAFSFYKKSFEMNLIKGRSIKGMVSACIYFACRINGIPITLNEIIIETNEPKKLIKSCYICLMESFNLKIPNVNPLLFFPKYISKLNLDTEIEKLSINILNIYLNNNLFYGKKPKGICAGAIYLASILKNQKINQKEICKKIGITVVTLRSRYKEIMTNIDLIFNYLIRE